MSRVSYGNRLLATPVLIPIEHTSEPMLARKCGFEKLNLMRSTGDRNHLRDAPDK